MKNEVWNLLGREVNIGEKIQFIAHLYEEDYDIPVTLINGVNKGKTIVVSAGVHSGEYPGMAACSILSEEIDPLKVNGRIIILHCINTQGFYTKHERFVPEDGGNMNDVFPGDKNGTLSKRLAAFLEENIIDEADFIVDLHSGQGEQLLSKCIFFPVLHKYLQKNSSRKGCCFGQFDYAATVSAPLSCGRAATPAPLFAVTTTQSASTPPRPRGARSAGPTRWPVPPSAASWPPSAAGACPAGRTPCAGWRRSPSGARTTASALCSRTTRPSASWT